METDTEKYNHKITDDEFLAVLISNNCLYAQTARSISAKFGIAFSRQAVQERAKKFKAETERYKEEIKDLAMGAIFDAINQNKDMKLKYRASVFIFNKLGNNNNEGSTPSTNETKP